MLAGDVRDPHGPGDTTVNEAKPVAKAGADPGRYRSYLVRLWREAPSGPWRCHVQCVSTGRELRFAGLQGLFDFLETDAARVAEERSEKGEAHEP